VGDSCTRNKGCAECRRFGQTGGTCNYTTGGKACPELIEIDPETEPFEDTESLSGLKLNPVVCPIEDDNCAYSFTVYLKEDNSEQYMAVDKKKVCSKSFPYIILIVALVLGLIALVLIPLIIWKLATWYKDSLEYQRFQAERAKAKWSKVSQQK
jgi:hypothetical protein